MPNSATKIKVNNHTEVSLITLWMDKHRPTFVNLTAQDIANIATKELGFLVTITAARRICKALEIKTKYLERFKGARDKRRSLEKRIAKLEKDMSDLKELVEIVTDK